MDTDVQFPVYDSVVRFLANRYSGFTTSNNPAPPDKLVALFIQEVDESVFQKNKGASYWQLWKRLFDYFLEQNFIRAQARGRRFDAVNATNDCLLLADVSLTFHEEYRAMVHMHWPFVEQISSIVIDPQLQTRVLASTELPRAIWVEWSPQPSSGMYKQPWIWKTVGLYIVSKPFFHAPIEKKREYAKQAQTDNDGKSPRGKFVVSIMDAAANGIPCLGFTIYVVKKSENEYDFFPVPILREQEKTIHNMLAVLHKTGDQENVKWKDLERIWGNIGVRILLIAIAHKWFSENALVDFRGITIPILNTHTGLLYSSSGGDNTEVQFGGREIPPTPFQIEKD